MSKRAKTVTAVILALLAVSGAAVYAASSYGSKSDPLITKSYLDEVFTPELQKEFKTMLGESGDSFAVVSLERGQRIVGEVGCQIMLRIGSAAVSAADSPGLVDTTDAGSLDNGAALTKNHLYMVTIAGNGVTASGSAKVLVMGGYTIE